MKPLNLAPLEGLDQAPLLAEIGVIGLVPDEWDDPWQPRHHVLIRLSRYFHVTWMGPLPDWRQGFKQGKCRSMPHAGFTLYRPTPWIPVPYRPRALVDWVFGIHLRRAREELIRKGVKRIVLYLWRPEFSAALGLVDHDLSCYHLDDEYSFSEVDVPSSEREIRLLRSVDQVIVHSPGLLDKKGGFNPNTVVVPNGVDYRAYSTRVPEPADLVGVPHPRIGYTGLLKKQLDWSLLLQLTERHADWSFVFIGPQSPHPEVRNPIEQLSKRPNVHFLGAKSSWDLASYPQHFDVCIMPYRVSDYTKYIYPLKLHEYLASGRPTVGTRIRSLESFAQVVGLALTAEEWSNRLTEALAASATTEESRVIRQQVAQQHDWELLVARIATRFSQGLGGDLVERLGARSRAVPADPGEGKGMGTELAIRQRTYPTLAARMKMAYQIIRDSAAWRAPNLRLLIGPFVDRERNSRAGHADRDHLLAAAAWLERAQDAGGDGGIAGRYGLRTGWTSSYPETTGYIVPTLIRIADLLGEPRFRERARRGIDFLLSVQLKRGAFPGLEIADNRTEPSIFNTAQIICGLRAWHVDCNDERALDAARRACDWLVAQQDPDGAWRKYPYGNVPSTYMAHAACWIAELGTYLDRKDYLDTARRHLEWVLQQQDPATGWFDLCGFTEESHRSRWAPTHTIAYTIWGVLMTSRILEHEAGMRAARTAAMGVARRLELSGWLPGILDHAWRGRAAYACLTGNAQMALVWLELHRLRGEPILLNAACKAIDLVKRAQPMSSSDAGIRGGIPGSDPVWGDYMYVRIPNWAAKFFIDALIEKQGALERQVVPSPAVATLPIAGHG